MRNRIINILIFSFVCFKLSAKDSVAYSKEYEIKEGFFLTLEDFVNNNPILKSAIVSNFPKSDNDFLTQVATLKYLVYKNDKNEEQKVEMNTMWGYCQNRTLYLNFHEEFKRVNVIGTLFHFTAMVRVYSPYNDPMNTSYGINPTYNQLQQFVYDTRTNKIIDFNVKNMEVVLKDDDSLYKEFMKLKKRKKADSIFIYLRKYNQKYALYLAKD